MGGGVAGVVNGGNPVGAGLGADKDCLGGVEGADELAVQEDVNRFGGLAGGDLDGDPGAGIPNEDGAVVRRNDIKLGPAGLVVFAVGTVGGHPVLQHAAGLEKAGGCRRVAFNHFSLIIVTPDTARTKAHAAVRGNKYFLVDRTFPGTGDAADVESFRRAGTDVVWGATADRTDRPLPYSVRAVKPGPGLGRIASPKNFLNERKGGAPAEQIPGRTAVKIPGPDADRYFGIPADGPGVPVVGGSAGLVGKRKGAEDGLFNLQNPGNKIRGGRLIESFF